MELEDYLKKADKVIDLYHNMIEAYGEDNAKEHLRIAIAAGLKDIANSIGKAANIMGVK